MTHVIIEIPLVSESESRPIGSSPADIIRLTDRQAIVTLMRVRTALHTRGAKLADDTPVVRYGDVVQWLMQQIAANEVPD